MSRFTLAYLCLYYVLKIYFFFKKFFFGALNAVLSIKNIKKNLEAKKFFENLNFFLQLVSFSRKFAIKTVFFFFNLVGLFSASSK